MPLAPINWRRFVRVWPTIRGLRRLVRVCFLVLLETQAIAYRYEGTMNAIFSD